MIEFGETLRKTREQKGLTTSQVAQTTHLLVQQIEALEREDFSKIAAPIYGRGFVKLYCEALGLDPKPFVEEFMAIFSGNKMRPIRRRMPTATPATPPAAQPVTAPVDMPSSADAPTITVPPPAPPAGDDAPTVIAGNPTAAENSPTMTTEALDSSCFNFARIDDAPTAPAQPSDFALESEPVSPKATRRPFQRQTRQDQPTYKPPTGVTSYRGENKNGGGARIPPAAWRMLALAVVGILVLWAVFAGIRALYRASMSTDGSKAGPAAAEQQQPAAPDGDTKDVKPTAAPKDTDNKPQTTRSSRKPMPIPPLYID